MGSVILFGSYIGLDPLTYILSGDQNRNHPLFVGRYPPYPFVGYLNIIQMLVEVHWLPDWKDFPASRRIDFPQMYINLPFK